MRYRHYPRISECASLAALLLTLLLAACGSGGKADPATQEAPAARSFALPALGSLPDSAPARSASASWPLLLNAPLLASPAGVDYTGSSVGLSAEPGRLSYAIFGLSGFPEDNSVVPTSLLVFRTAECWIGLSNYSTGSWDFIHSLGSNNHTLSQAADYSSPDGIVYVAVLVWGGSTSVGALTLSTNIDFPGAPTAKLNIVGEAVDGWPVSFNALGSDGGLGAITSLRYNFGDGEIHDTLDPAEVVEHTFSSPGQQTVSLTVFNDQGRNASANRQFTPAVPNRELIVVCNSDIPEDLDLANYYMSPATGRGIDPAYRLDLPLGALVGDTIPRTSATESEIDYEEDIRDAIRQFITASSLSDSIKYILLMKGIPHRISGAGEFDPNNCLCSAVDSELCTLFEDGGYELRSFLWAGTSFLGYSGPGNFHLSSDSEFTPNTFKLKSIANQNVTLNYLVGRLTAYTYDNAKELVDRSLNADTSGEGWVVLDSVENRIPLDTMVDPVYLYDAADASLPSGEELLGAAGFKLWVDTTSATLKLNAGEPSLPPDWENSVIGYAGWGVNHGGAGYPSGQSYILEDLGFNYLPGCCWISYESFNGTDFDDPLGDGSGINHRGGQGQVADFLRRGGTCCIGHAWEPFTLGVGDERWVLDRYLNHGDRWIEAAYKGMRCYSWMQMVVGDPLCRVRP